METVIKKIGENTITKQMAAESIKDIAIGFADATVGLLDWEGLIKAAAGIAEETVLKLSGPTGWGIDTIFKTSKYGCYVMQATEIGINLDSIPVCVHTPHPAESFSINGVSVDGTGSVPEGAMLQVFRVYDADALVWFDDKEDTLANNDYELYNICLVKGDETVSSDGIVSVKIRIPEGYSENLRLYRQEPDGSWTSIKFTIQGDYLLFYTDHFSKYVIFYPKAQFTDCGGKLSECPSAKYTDVPPYGNWAHKGIDFCIDRGIMGSTKTDSLTFEPNTACTRSMIVSILYRLSGSPKVTYEAKFPDVKTGQWYTDAVIWAYQNGIVSGYGDGTFGPNDKITREQMAVILKGYADFKGIDTSKMADLSDFPDCGKVTWSKAAVRWAVAEGLISGKSNNGQTLLDPQGNATRAEVASILMRFIQSILEK